MRSAKGWWHSFDLPDGTRIDGVHPVEVLRERIQHFPIPQDLRGQRVLDIGTWDGWYSFEMERRGAEVLAIDNWDNPRFRQIHGMLGSRVEYRTMDMFDLTPERIGRFDIVLFMGVLYHLKHPLLALERVCALTTGIAAIESFVIRDSHRSNENVDKRPIMEFYETDEFGGQPDNWIGPSIPCLLALCRAAGFARVELQRVMDFGVAVACYRKWEPASSDLPHAPRLVLVEQNPGGGFHFDSRHDEYASAWFTCAASNLGLDSVKPEAGGYGVRPIYVAQLEDGSWQTNFKLPPGLEPGWHEVKIRLDDGPASNAKRIALDLPQAMSAGPIAAADPRPEYRNAMNVQSVVSDIHARIEREHGLEPFSAQVSEELIALRDAYQRLYQSRNALGKLPPAPNTLRAKIGGLLVRGVQRCLFWYTPQIAQFQSDTVSALDNVSTLIGRQFAAAGSLEQGLHTLRREMLDGLHARMNSQFEKTRSLEQELRRVAHDVTELRGNGMRPATAATQPASPNASAGATQGVPQDAAGEAVPNFQVYLEALSPVLAALPAGLWLDVGCRRGEWMETVSKRGFRVLGLDSDAAAVACCREQGLEAEETDALTRLRTLPDLSVALVTAFHILEESPMHGVLAMFQEAHRILKPAGLLIVETRRRVPAPVLDFLYAHFGFTVVQRLAMTPTPEASALDTASGQTRHDGESSGRQDFGFIGRR